MDDDRRTRGRAGFPAASLLRDFVNTLDVECADDAIDTAGRLVEWLAGRGLAPRDARAGRSELDLAITLREGLRAAMLAHHVSGAPAPSLPYSSPAPPVSPGAGPGPPKELERALGRLPLRLTLAGGRPALVPLTDGTTAALARVAAAIMESAADGSWPRLKVCLDDTCQWAFLDTSKNRSRSWCSMRVCGNRAKTRAYRARRRPRAASQ